MVNVVCYDGCDAYVMKFVLKCSKEHFELADKYCKRGGMETLKFDVLYDLTFDNIVALKTGDSEQQACYDRFVHMFFE